VETHGRGAVLPRALELSLDEQNILVLGLVVYDLGPVPGSGRNEVRRDARELLLDLLGGRKELRPGADLQVAHADHSVPGTGRFAPFGVVTIWGRSGFKERAERGAEAKVRDRLYVKQHGEGIQDDEESREDQQSATRGQLAKEHTAVLGEAADEGGDSVRPEANGGWRHTAWGLITAAPLFRRRLRTLYSARLLRHFGRRPPWSLLAAEAVAGSVSLYRGGGHSSTVLHRVRASRLFNLLP
jgi:hypothetical protein